MHRAFFITGTDTEIGKTYVTRLLLADAARAGQRCAGLKPVASGAVHTDEGLRNDDALQLQAAASVALPYEEVNPYCFVPPVAPHVAAAQAGVEIDFERIVSIARRVAAEADLLLVEGVGGWMVPLGSPGSVADLARRLGFPVILVVGMRLGCINHALLTARAIVDDGLSLAGWIANPVDETMAAFAENLAALRARIAAPCLGVLQRDDTPQQTRNVTRITLV